MRKTTWWLPRIVASFIVLFSFLSFSQPANADDGKELTNVITDISLLDVGSGEAMRPNSAGTYQLTKDASYRFENKFDLSKYDGNLSDGDYFTFTIPAPLTVNNTSFDLLDKETNLAVGTAVVTSKGSEQGGTVKITLKNLAEYLQKKGGTQIQGVKGTFYTEFIVDKVIKRQTITYPTSETAKVINHTISVQEYVEGNYSEWIKHENFSKGGGVMSQEQWYSPTLNKSGNFIHNWYLRVNTNQSTYDTIKLHDNIPSNSAPMQYIPEKLMVYAGYFNAGLNLTESRLLTEGSDYRIEYNSSYTSFELKLLNTANRLAANGKPAAYNVFYATTSPANGTNIVNGLSMQGNEQDVTLSTETTKTVDQVERSTKITTGGTIQLDTGYRITLYKQDSETGDLLKGAEFEITSPSGSKETVTTDENGVAQSKVYSASEVAKGQFTIVETKAPEGYVLDSTPIKVSVGEAGVIRRIQNTRKKIAIPVTKKWDDNNNQDGTRPKEVKVQLLANGKEVDGSELTLSADNNWSGRFENLNEYDKNGKKIDYSIKEIDVSNDYTSKISGDAAKGYVITNTHTPAKTEISGTKTWNDSNDQDGKRPNSITVNLLADGKVVDKQVVTASTNWSYKFSNLAKYQNGKEIKYTITEDPVKNYTTQVDGYNITNSYTPETVDIKATKNWNDNDDQDGKRPSQITVNLLADGQKVDSKQISVANDGTWTADFTGLPKYKNGKEIKYTVTEEAVAEYESTITDFNIVNKYIPKTIEYKVTKAWDDNNNQDGKRPDQITVQLYKSVAGSEPVAVPGKTLTLTTENKVDDNTWSASFTDLPQFEKGQEISYSVKEVDTPDGYNSNVSGQLITNSHIPETVVISGTKVWNDNNDQDGKRTTSVKIQILNGDQVVDEIETSKDKNWSFESKELPKYENGQEINYTVKEVAVAAYETTITKDSDGKYTLTNSHTPEKIDLTGQKSWNDNNDQDGMRPASITVELLANGKSTGKTATTSAAQNWTYSFTGVDRYQDGKEIIYSVREVDTPAGYTSQVAGLNITNSHQPETIDVSGTKTWNDNNDQDKIRPTTITVHLLADGKDTGLTATASVATNWKYSFKDVAKYNNGKKVTYTVVEDEVAGYTATVDGMNVTNTHTPTTKEETPPPSPNNPDKPTTPDTPGSSNNTPPKSDTPVPPKDTTTSVLKENNVPATSSSKTTSNSNSLPATNGIDEPFYLIIGLILELLGLSGVVYFVRRKKN